jgi:myo-inositol-1(or 4)-monophosphatase
MNEKSICEAVCEIAIEAGKFIRQERLKFHSSEIIDKSWNQLVSYVDVETEKMLVQQLKGIVPQASFITEENTVERREARLQWIIDPLDGTTNFMHGIPPYAVSVALAEGEQLLVGVVYEVTAGECFAAWKGGGAFLNQQPIRVSENALLKNSITATGFPPGGFKRMENYFTTLQHLFVNSRAVRRLGSAAVDIAYVACGRFDAFYEYELNAWDVGGASLIVQEAGGVVSDFAGGNKFLFGKEIIACNQNFYAEFRKLVNCEFR